MNWISEALGLEVERLNAAQMAARAFVVFLAALILLRIAGMRTLGKQTEMAIDCVTLSSGKSSIIRY